MSMISAVYILKTNTDLINLINPILTETNECHIIYKKNNLNTVSLIHGKHRDFIHLTVMISVMSVNIPDRVHHNAKLFDLILKSYC